MTSEFPSDDGVSNVKVAVVFRPDAARLRGADGTVCVIRALLAPMTKDLVAVNCS